MSKIHKKLGLLLAAVVVVVILVIFLGKGGLVWQGSSDGNYVAVYMSSGDIYFGKLERSGYMSLANVYTLQRTENKNTPFNLVKFGDAFWGPKGNIELSRENVLWVAELSEDSQVVKSIKSQEAAE